MFKIGQEVVCINKGGWLPTNRKNGYLLPGPKFEEVCVIEGFHTNPDFLYLKGHSEMGLNGRHAYDKSLFRPVVKSHKGMEVLREILINSKVKIKEDA